MRAKLLLKIKGSNQVKFTDLTKRAICSLFLDFLKRENFQYTPTVFVPECGHIDKMLSLAELKEYLGLPEIPDTSLLEHILEKIKEISTRPHLFESYAQTEDSPATGLESRLQQLDAEFIYKTKSTPNNLEERMAKYKKDCDERMRYEINSELTRIKEVEISAVRIEEAAKYRQLLQKMREEQEQHWKTQIEILKDREKEQRERIFIREKEIEIRENRQRQQFEKELDILKTKENDMKRSIEIELEGAKLQKNSWEHKKLEVESKLKELENFKISMANKAQDDFNQYKRNFEAEFEEEKRRLYNERFELKALAETLDQEFLKIRKTEEKVKELEEKIEEITKQKEYFRTEYEKSNKEIYMNREELRLVTETSRRNLDLLTFKDQEIATIKSEAKSYKELYFEQKEALKKYEANQQLLMEKILAGNSAPNVAESDFLAERKAVWKQLDKESLDIKKNMVEMINKVKDPSEHYRTSFRPVYRPHHGTKYRTDPKDYREEFDDGHLMEYEQDFVKDDEIVETNKIRPNLEKIEKNSNLKQTENIESFEKQAKNTAPIKYEESDSGKSSSKSYEEKNIIKESEKSKKYSPTNPEPKTQEKPMFYKFENSEESSQKSSSNPEPKKKEKPTFDQFENSEEGSQKYITESIDSTSREDSFF
jgi:hypothetical protein